jgi:hypothetical protein
MALRRFNLGHVFGKKHKSLSRIGQQQRNNCFLSNMMLCLGKRAVERRLVNTTDFFPIQADKFASPPKFYGFFKEQERLIINVDAVSVLREHFSKTRLRWLDARRRRGEIVAIMRNQILWLRFIEINFGGWGGCVCFEQ